MRRGSETPSSHFVQLYKYLLSINSPILGSRACFNENDDMHADTVSLVTQDPIQQLCR